MSQSSSYKQILKSTSLFGGVQVFTIIISIVRSKFVAVLLGPKGIGIAGLLMSTIDLIYSITGLGIERSAVKNISAMNNVGKEKEISKVITVTNYLVWITGLFGSLITLVFASQLSEFTFGNDDYKYAFIWLSVILLLKQLSAGHLTVLRGLRKLNYMAISSLVGSISGLVISIPIYYIYGIDGIVPAIIISTVIIFVTTSYFVRKVNIRYVKPSRQIFFREGKNIVGMGVILSLSSIIVMLVAYLVRIYISSAGSVEDVGFYNAAFAIVGSYFGVFFTSLTTDYYPRLARIASNMKEASKLMNEQSEMTVLILSPILLIFLVFIKLIIVLLYSSKFSPINELIMWASLGMFFKAASFAIGVIYISKGDSKTLLFTEIVTNGTLLLTNIYGYKHIGLEGIGIAYLISFLVTFFLNYKIINSKYKFVFSKDFIKIFLVQLIFGVSGFIIMRFLSNPWNYIFGILMIGISSVYSYIELDKRMDIKSSLKNIANKILKPFRNILKNKN